jgi:hypothetical protein
LQGFLPRLAGLPYTHYKLVSLSRQGEMVRFLSRQ